MEKLKRKQWLGFGSFGETEISMLGGTIIGSFFPEAEEMTIKEIQERAGYDHEYSYERVNSTLKSLAEKKIVVEKQSGKTLVYSLDSKNLYAESMGFNAYMLQRKIEFIKKHKPIYDVIKKVVESPYVMGVILFGSYSKKTETKHSDVDLMCISDKKKETEHLVKSLKYESNVEFSPIVIPMHEFPDIKIDNLVLWNDLKRYGIVFKGKGTFYYWMYKDEKN